MDRQRLEAALADSYDADEEMRRVVGRQARDLVDAGTIATDFGHTLQVEDVLDNLADAPDDHSLVERWNWWIASLEVSHEGYGRFQIRQDLV